MASTQLIPVRGQMAKTENKDIPRATIIKATYKRLLYTEDINIIFIRIHRRKARKNNITIAKITK
jgi:hypothetical protein